ncbi:F-box domain-containing protein [Abortiporus biennis]
MAGALPNETLTTIFECLHPSTLAHVVRVSRRFHAVAERILYSNIAIAESLPRTSPVPYLTLCFCNTILRRQYLSEVVRKLNIRWQTESGPRDSYMPYIEPILQNINAALRTLVGLESLELALGLSGGTISSRGILDNCSFPSLRLFSISGVGRGNASFKAQPEPSPPIEWFLTATPSIQHLRLADFYEGLKLEPTDLPLLSTFRGSAPTAASILPGRPVQFLSLVGHEFVTERDLEKIACSSARIRWLDLSSMSVTPILLRDISRHLFGVEFLKLKLALRHTLHHALSGISLLAGLTSVLNAFPELYQLDLSPTPVDRIGEGNALEELQLCTTWARGCPSLRHIIFPSRTEWILKESQDVSGPDRWIPIISDSPSQAGNR